MLLSSPSRNINQGEVVTGEKHRTQHLIIQIVTRSAVPLSLVIIATADGQRWQLGDDAGKPHNQELRTVEEAVAAADHFDMQKFCAQLKG